MNPTTVVTFPTPLVCENLIEIAATRWQGRNPAPTLRACAWASLLRQRRRYGDLARARRAAWLREQIIRRAARERAS